MKKLIAVLSLFVLFGCSKEQVIEDNTKFVVGSYVGFQLDADGKTIRLPYNGLRASALVAKTGVNRVKYNFSLISPTANPLTISFDCRVENIGYDEYNLIDEITEIKVARFKSNSLINKILGQDITVYLDKQ